MAGTTRQIIDDLRRRGAGRADIELKAAAGGLPKALCDTLSAFANGAGGTILLGVSDDFQPVDIDAVKLRNEAAQMAADQLEPPVRAEIEIDVIDRTHKVVRMDIPRLP